MDILDIQKAVSDADFRSLWSDLVRSLPRCSNCHRRPSMFVSREYPQYPPIYSCGTIDDPECHSSDLPWEETPWKSHVMAAALMRL